MAEKKTILIVDDTRENVDILMCLLEGYDLLVALDGQSALDIAGEEKIDLILLDIIMPGMNGFQTCEKLKLDNRTNDIPIIFITVRTDERSIEKAFDTGGLDYVTKPFKPKELLARVKTQLKLHSLIDHLEYLSSYDQMTGIYNRRKFFELSIEKFSQSRDLLFAVMIDIDKFKAINDTYGHSTGDNVIKTVAGILRDKFDEDAVLGRVGGEEFAIIISSPLSEYVFNTIESMRTTVERLEFTSDNNEVFSITISSGIAKIKDHHKIVDDLLKDADDSLYEAKGTGRNKSIFRS